MNDKGIERVLRAMTTKIFDEISQTIHTDHFFLRAQKDWRFLDKALYQACRNLGVDRVRGEIQEVNRMAGIRNKGGYLWTRLQNMQKQVCNG